MPSDAKIEETPEERLERYRRMADSTRDLAMRSDDAQIKKAYLELAGRWVQLAEQAAAELRVGHDAPSAPPRARESRLAH